MKKKLIAIAAAVTAVIPFAPSTASAGGPGAGVVAFECTAELDNFPATTGSGTCSGGATVPLPSAGAGAIAGIADDDEAYAVGGAGTFEASFTYAEGCVLEEPPLTGSAEGSATISGLTGVKGSGPDAEVVTATLTLDFTWTRVGLAAAVTLSDGTLTFDDGETATTFIGTAEAAFAPILTEDNLCPQGGPLEAAVAGSAQLVDATT
ncbi:MAG TPA: hypothetical protein VHJ76_00985 [Actinomycetota bacterium]|nr:hypothetical protein [Actinomycetota bacterium]